MVNWTIIIIVVFQKSVYIREYFRRVCDDPNTYKVC